MDDYRLQQTGQEVQDILNGAAMQTSLDEEVLRAKQAENTLQGNIDNEELARQGADTTLQQNIDAEKTRAEGAEGVNSTRITMIEGKIPTQASPTNQLADKDFVNSSIANSTATFRGTYNLLTDLELSLDATTEQIAAKLPDVISHPKKNEYCFVQIPTSTEVPTQIAKIERYKYSGQAWEFEYDLNNSSFTSDQWAAINSGITSDLVTKLGALPTASELATALLGKQDVLQYDELPVNGSQKMVKSGGIYTAIKNSSDALSAVIDGILAMIPSAASALNQLADKAFVNSSISTATATFRGTYNLVTDLELAIDATHEQIAIALDELVTTADNNDYCFVQVPTSTDTPTEIAKTERYKFNGSHWAFEYELNTSGFTAAQWSAINSGITAVLTGKLSDLPTASELSAAFTAITDLIPSEATAQNQLADKMYVLSQILAAIPVFKGQFTTLAELQAVASPTDGDLGIVRTKDFDGLDVFTFYQYLNSQWNVFYTLQNHPQTKPASTGTTGDYPYNGMGRVVLEKNMQNIAGAGEPENIVCLLTQDMFYKGPAGSRVPNENTIFVIRYDYVLDSDITVPANCVLEFDGGSISADGNSDTITCQNTTIDANYKVFDGVTVTGVINNYELYLEWWHKGEDQEDCTFGISNLSDLCTWSWDGRNHCIVLINGRIKVQPNVFVVENGSVEGNDCMLSNASNTRTGVGITLTGMMGGTNYNLYVKNVYIANGNFDIGILKQGEHDLKNVSVQRCNVGCKLYNGNNYLSEIVECNFNYNYQFGLVIDNSVTTATSAGVKVVRSTMSENVVAGLYSVGGGFAGTIDTCTFEHNGRQADDTYKAGAGIAIVNSPTEVNIINCTFETEGTTRGIGIIFFAFYNDLYNSSTGVGAFEDLRENFENAGVPEGIGNYTTSGSIFIDNMWFQGTNGIYVSTNAGKFGIDIKNVCFTQMIAVVASTGAPCPIEFNPNFSVGLPININNVTGDPLCLNRGFSKTPIGITGGTASSTGVFITYAINIKYNGTPISTYILYDLSILDNIVTNSETGSCKLYPTGDFSEYYHSSLSIGNSQVLSNYSVVMSNLNSGTSAELRDENDNLPTISAGMYFILPNADGIRFIYKMGSGSGYYTSTVLTDKLGVLKFPSNVHNAPLYVGAYTKEAPFYLLSEQDFINAFNAYKLEYEKCNRFEYIDDKEYLYGRGTTANRPIIPKQEAYNGYCYFDTGLGKPIYWVKNPSDSTWSWVDATGTAI